MLELTATDYAAGARSSESEQIEVNEWLRALNAADGKGLWMVDGSDSSMIMVRSTRWLSATEPEIEVVPMVGGQPVIDGEILVTHWAKPWVDPPAHLFDLAVKTEAALAANAN